MRFALQQRLAALLAETGIPAQEISGEPLGLQLAHEHWTAMAKLAKGLGLRLVAVWAAQQGETFTIHAAFAHKEHGYALIKTAVAGDAFPSITPYYVAAARMERIIHDLYGLLPAGHPDTRTWIKHEHWPQDAFPLRKTFAAASQMPRIEGRYPFLEAEGDGVYEIPVGPVHAGIIEPGHFRFLAVGEQVLNLEERLGYVHKGIEKAMEGRDVFSGARLAGRISGDATVSHAWAFCQAAEQAAGLAVPPRAVALRAVLCERERLANHIGDIGAVCNDAAWSFMHMQCQRLREELARAHQQLFGHRLLMDCVKPGGVERDVDDAGIQLLLVQTRAVAAEMRELYDTYENHTPIRERVIDSGNVKAADAAALGLLGYAGRSALQDFDARRDWAYPPYDRHPPRIAVCRGGDVAGRVWVRFMEIQDSARLIDSLLHDLPRGEISTAWQLLHQDSCGFAVIESWRGEIAAWLRLATAGNVDRYYVRDPSMINWLGLELAAREVPVPDFPLNNKSFNCSYSGHDL
jgi:Ni,Fe-hydrogenase III large subunit/Ni,Fe-hydrogenase III component G